MSIKLISLNIEGDNHLPQVFQLIEQESPDVICFNEVYEADVPTFKHVFGMDGVFQASEVLRVPNNYRLAPRGNMGALILSKHPIITSRVSYYQGSGDHIPELTNEHPNAANRFLLWADIQIDGQIHTFVSTHFTITQNAAVTDLQRQNLAQVLSMLSEHNEFVFCGDFNAPRGGEIFDTLAAHYKDNIPGDVVTTLDPTLHRAGNKLPNIVVDGLFTTPSYEATNIRVLFGVSDHCAIVAEIAKQE